MSNTPKKDTIRFKTHKILCKLYKDSKDSTLFKYLYELYKDSKDSIHKFLYKLCEDVIVVEFKTETSIDTYKENTHKENTHKDNVFYVITTKDLQTDSKKKIRENLRSYHSSVQEDMLNVCSKSLSSLLFITMAAILVFSLMAKYFYIPSLHIFAIDMILIFFSYKLLISFVEFTKKNSLDDYQATYYLGKEEIFFSNNEPLIKDKSVFTTGFVLILITFSFYTSSLSLNQG